MHRPLYTLLLALLVLGSGGRSSAADGKALFQSVCAACHGLKGEGNEVIKSPSIASLPSWYMVTQLGNFHDGRRGADPASDPQGAVMSAIAKPLQPDQVKAVAEYVESLPLVVPETLEVPGADLKEGMLLFQERCMECHRYNASGEMTFGSPPLVGRQGWYLLAQLKKFKGLHRGAAKGDVNGAKMTQMVNHLRDEQAMRDVVSYILTLNPPAAKAGVSDEKK